MVHILDVQLFELVVTLPFTARDETLPFMVELWLVGWFNATFVFEFGTFAVRVYIHKVIVNKTDISIKLGFCRFFRHQNAKGFKKYIYLNLRTTKIVSLWQLFKFYLSELELWQIVAIFICFKVSSIILHWKRADRAKKSQIRHSILNVRI